MSIFKRTKDILTSSVNGLLDKVEDPIKLLNQYMTDLGKEITKAETQVAKQIATTKRLEGQVREAEKMVNQRTAQAKQALLANNEELAKRALEDKQTWQTKLDALAPAYEQNFATSESLKEQLTEMKEKYREMQGKRHELEARASAAKATKSMNESVSGIGKNNAAKGFERMENKVMEMEAQASASMDMAGMKQKSLDDEFKGLGAVGVDDELAQLKAQMGSTDESFTEDFADTSESTEAPKSSVDAELEAMRNEMKHQ